VFDDFGDEGFVLLFGVLPVENAVGFVAEADAAEEVRRVTAKRRIESMLIPLKGFIAKRRVIDFSSRRYFQTEFREIRRAIIRIPVLERTFRISTVLRIGSIEYVHAVMTIREHASDAIFTIGNFQIPPYGFHFYPLQMPRRFFKKSISQ
jgi:hypothetical protein